MHRRNEEDNHHVGPRNAATWRHVTISVKRPGNDLTVEIVSAPFHLLNINLKISSPGVANLDKDVNRRFGLRSGKRKGVKKDLSKGVFVGGGIDDVTFISTWQSERPWIGLERKEGDCVIVRRILNKLLKLILT